MPQITSSDVERWTAIRDAAFPVVLLTRRSNGFWKLPTTKVESMETHHDPGSFEDEVRREQGFGYESVTVSFYALTALVEATESRVPDIVSKTLQAFHKHRDSDSGGYGSPKGSHTSRIYNSLPRHTASAAAAYLLYSPERTSPSLAKLIDPTVNWLLRTRLRGGGWPLALDKNRLGYLTTAAGILALSLYLRVREPSGRTASSVRAVATKAYAALADAQASGVWEGDGITSQQLRYCATALRFLQMARRHGALDEIADSHPLSFDELLARFAANDIDGGWPDERSDDRPSTVANITALDVIIGGGNPSGLPEERLGSAEQAILDAWRSRTLAPRLRAWDWQCLLLLAAKKAGPISAGREAELRRVCDKILRALDDDSLNASALSSFDDGTGAALEYALTKGEGFETGHAKRYLKDRLLEFVNGTVVKAFSAALIAAIAIASIFLLGPEKGDRIRDFLARLVP